MLAAHAGMYQAVVDCPRQALTNSLCIFSNLTNRLICIFTLTWSRLKYTYVLHQKKTARVPAGKQRQTSCRENLFALMLHSLNETRLVYRDQGDQPCHIIALPQSQNL